MSGTMKAAGFARLALLILLTAIACRSERATTKSAPVIAVIPKGTTHEFWKSVHAGAMKAAEEVGVEITWKGPLKEDDLKAQIDVVQSFVAQGVSGIVLAPLNDKGLVGAVQQARASKIPVVIFDSDLQGHEHVSFVATDNRAAGRMAGEEMVKLLGGKGNVVVLRYNEGSASTANRESGFLDVVGKSPGIRVVSDNQYGGATTESAFSTSENLLAATKAGAGAVDGIFCPNESTTFGMLLALEKSGLAGKMKFVGFDSSSKLIEGLKQGHIDGLVLQNPFNMGYLAVKTMSQHLKGEKIEPRLDTGATFVTKQNLEQPEIRELVAPDLKKWLKE
jgi:ribose transport system substrate-binding protein